MIDGRPIGYALSGVGILVLLAAFVLLAERC